MESGQTHPFRIYLLNERALTVEAGAAIGHDVLAWVLAAQQVIQLGEIPGVVEVVTAYTTVTVMFDPLEVYRFSPHTHETASQIIRKQVEDILNSISVEEHARQSDTVVIPVCYEEAFAPDLAWVAEHHRTTPGEIVHRHTSQIFTVYLIGFTPGFPYMGVLPDGLQSPRKPVPRTAVPAGSVGLAGKQTGIYPYTTPGGWQIIGRTPRKLFDPHRARPAWLKAGDRVRFEAISSDEFNRMQS